MASTKLVGWVSCVLGRETPGGGRGGKTVSHINMREVLVVPFRLLSYGAKIY